jgi:hypothetical protein
MSFDSVTGTPETVTANTVLRSDMLSEDKANIVRLYFPMPPEHRTVPSRRKLTPIEILQRLLNRVVKLDGFQMVISELEVEPDYLRRAIRYLEE